MESGKVGRVEDDSLVSYLSFLFGLLHTTRKTSLKS